MDRWYQVGCLHKAPDAEWVRFGPGEPAADRQIQGTDRSAESRCRNGGYPRLADGAVEEGLEKSWKSLKIFLTTEAQLVKGLLPPVSRGVAFLRQPKLQQRLKHLLLDVTTASIRVLVIF